MPHAAISSTAWTPGAVMRHAITASGRRRRLPIAALLLTGHQGSEALVPVVIGVIVDRAIEPGDSGALIAWLGALGLLFVVLSSCWRYGWRRSNQLVESTDHDLRLLVAERAMHAGGVGGGDDRSGAVLTTATNDTAAVAELPEMLCYATANSLALVIAGIALFQASGPLALLVLLGLPPALGLMRLLSRPLERRMGAEAAVAAEAGAIATNLAAGLRVVKGIGAERAAARRYRDISQQSLAASLRTASSLAVFTVVSKLIPGLILAAVALAAGRLAIDGVITVGDFVTVVGLAQYAAGPFQMLVWVATTVAKARSSAVRVADLLAAPPSVIDGTADAPSGAIELRAVRCGRAGPIDLRIEAGKIVGIVTGDEPVARAVVDLLARHVDPDDGAVLLGDRDLREMTLDDLRRSIVVSAHDAALFEGTASDNIVDTVAAPEMAERILATDLVRQLDAELADGLDSHVGERGISLSGGQRQRVALARVLASGADVIACHDPTTAVDALTEHDIADDLRRIRAGRTTILVTTSPSLLAVCDAVLFLDGAAGPSSGTHQELSSHDDYRRLVFA